MSSKHLVTDNVKENKLPTIGLLKPENVPENGLQDTFNFSSNNSL